MQLHLQQLLDVSGVDGFIQLREKSILLHTRFNELSMNVLVSDELMTNLTVCEREREEKRIYLVHSHVSHTHVGQSGDGLLSVRLASRTSFRSPFPITSAICGVKVHVYQ